MHLYTIPLCTARYVGDILSGATFKYDARGNIIKNKQKLFYKETEIEIHKVNIGQLFYKEIPIEVEKRSEQLLYKDAMQVNKDTLENKSLLEANDIDITVYNQKQVARDIDYELDNLNNVMSFKDNNNIKDIAINSNIELSREFAKDMDINSNVSLKIAKEFTGINKVEAITIERVKEKELNITSNNKYIDTTTSRVIDIKINNIYTSRADAKKIDVLASIYLQREINKEISKDSTAKLVYRANSFKLDKYNFVNLDINNIKNIDKNINSKLVCIDAVRPIGKSHSSKLFYIDTLKSIDKYSMIQGLDKDIIRNIDKYDALSLDKDSVKNISKINAFSLDKNNIKDIFKDNPKHLNNISFINIDKEIQYGLNKTETQIFNEINLYGLNKGRVAIWKDKQYGLNKPRVIISKDSHSITSLEVTKRWWVLGATSPTDLKILPWDYNYSKPLSINRRDREYGNMIDQSNHPISFMPYLENNKGMDLGYGTNEMALSIEIMLDMVNIVGMIVQHSATQFANASGQEVIEFILELLIDWLNLDSTIAEMRLKGSREHYLRCYRWIRWEAEKAWFKADKDHSIGRMMGIKYAGMLFANLLDYMKYHHFNLVPLWRNLKVMDIERQFNRTPINGDLMKDLDKLKSKRHYYIETKNKI